MARVETKSVDQSATFHSWYVRRGKTYNEQRRAKYAADAAVRKKAQQRAQQHKKEATPHTGLVNETVLAYLSDGTRVQAYTTGHIAAAVNRTAETVRQWERRGLLPAPTIPGGKRLYLKHQRALIKTLAKLLDKSDAAQVKEFQKTMLTEW